MLTESGHLYGWGSNAQLMLSNKQGDYKSKPTLISVPSSSPIKQVSAGCTFACILCEDGHIYCWGDNKQNQCGLEQTTPTPSGFITTPTLVPGVEDVVEISCGSDFTLCLTKSGEVIVFGSNSKCQLSLTSAKHSVTPTKLKLPLPIRQVAAGLDFSVLLAEDGTVYASGYISDNTYFQFTEVMSMKEGCTAIYAGGERAILVTKDGRVFQWGKNISEKLMYLRQPQLLPLPPFSSLQVSLGMTHACLLLVQSKMEDTTSLFNFNAAELKLLDSWNPEQRVAMYKPKVASLSPFESVALMLAYLDLSNQIFFENQKLPKGKPDSKCFLIRVTEQSVAQNLTLISDLLQMYYDTYSANLDRSAGQSSMSGKESSGKSASTTSNQLVRPPTSSSAARTQNATPLPKPGSQSAAGKGSLDMSINEDDILMDENELLNMEMDGYQTIDHKHQAVRSHLFDSSGENKEVLYALYSGVNLLYVQQLFYLYSEDLAFVNVFQVDLAEPSSLLTLIFKILEIDSNSTEISVIKKKANSIICNLIGPIDDISPFYILMDMIFTEYERIKDDPKLDHFSLLDTALALLKYLVKSNVIENIKTKEKYNSFLNMLKRVFSSFSTIFSSYIRVLSSDQHDLDVSGLTEVIHYILELLLSIYNDDFVSVMCGKSPDLNVLKEDGANVINVCQCVFEFSKNILECFVETATLENDISKQLADFLFSSPAYRNIEYVLYVCYSIVLHFLNISDLIRGDVKAVVQESVKSVCVLLEPLGQIVILQNQCINLFEHNSSACCRRSESDACDV